MSTLLSAPGRAWADPIAPMAPPAEYPSGSVCAVPSRTIANGTPWAQQRLAWQRVWPFTRGQGVTVAVVDSGVDGRVRQLRGAVESGVDAIGSQVPAATDCYGHGTFVAGLVAARPIAAEGFTGVAPDATILPIRHYDATHRSVGGLVRAIREAADRRVKVLNVSSATVDDSAELRAAVRYAADRDVLIVASTSNAAQQGNPRAYPAAYPEVLAVGASDRNGQRAQFSVAGDFVDLVAPGVDIVSLWPGADGHRQDSGTSYAAPLVAGTAALVRSYYPELTAAQVKRRLELTADRPGRTVPDAEYGWGVVNPYAAITTVLSGQPTAVPRPALVAAVPAPDSDDRDRLIALLFAAGAAVLTGTIALTTWVLRRARRNPATHCA